MTKKNENLRPKNSNQHHCKKCKKPTEVRKGMFHWRGKSFSGLVCEDCNALYDNPEDSFNKHVQNNIV